MQRPTRPFHDSISRRQLLVSSGSLLAGAAGASVLTSQDAAAAVSTRSLNIPDASHEGKDGSVANVTLQTQGPYEYAANAADSLQFALKVAPPEHPQNYETVDSLDEPVSTASGAGQFDLNGSILDHAAMDAATFSADAGETVSREVPVRVLLDVRNGGESVVEAMAETVALIEVTNTGVEASAAITGEGEIGLEM